MGLEGTLVSSGGRLPSGTEIGEGGYHGETYGAELADLAYKGLGDIVPQKAGPLAQPLVHASRCAILTVVVTTFFLSDFAPNHYGGRGPGQRFHPPRVVLRLPRTIHIPMEHTGDKHNRSSQL